MSFYLCLAIKILEFIHTKLQGCKVVSMLNCLGLLALSLENTYLEGSTAQHVVNQRRYSFSSHHFQEFVNHSGGLDYIVHSGEIDEYCTCLKPVFKAIFDESYRYS